MIDEFHFNSALNSQKIIETFKVTIINQNYLSYKVQIYKSI